MHGQVAVKHVRHVARTACERSTSEQKGIRMTHDWILAFAAAPVFYVVLFALAAIDGVFPLVPSESVVIAAAALAVSSGAPDLVLIVLTAAAGAFVGDQLAYALGARVDVRGLRILRGPSGRKTVRWAERALTERGPSVILAARYVPIGRVAVNATAGAVAFDRRTFVALTAVASVMWAIYSAAIGLIAGAWLQSRPLVAIAVGVGCGLLGGIAMDWALTRRSAHAARRRPVPAATAIRPPATTLVREAALARVA